MSSSNVVKITTRRTQSTGDCVMRSRKNTYRSLYFTAALLMCLSLASCQDLEPQARAKAQVSAQSIAENCDNILSPKANYTGADNNLEAPVALESNCPLPSTLPGVRWVWEYFSEQTMAFNPLVKDETFEARVAHLNLITMYARGANMDNYVINTGDSTRDHQLEREVAGSRVDDQLCGQDLGQMLKVMGELGSITAERRKRAKLGQPFCRDPKADGCTRLNEAHYRVAKVFESMGRYEDGFLGGKIHFLGNYLHCDGSEMQLGDRRVPARYCTARLRPPLKSMHPSLNNVTWPWDMSAPALFVGTCLPETCHIKSFKGQGSGQKNMDLAKRLVSSHFRLPKELFIEQDLELEGVFCAPDHDSLAAKVPFHGKLLIFLLIIWLITMYSVTRWSDWFKNSQNPHLRHLAESLNLQESYKDFTLQNKKIQDTSQTSRLRRVELDTLNPIKVLGCAFVVFGHSLMTVAQTSADIFRTGWDVEHDHALVGMINATIITDTFYVITGLLMTYITLGKLEKSKILLRAKMSTYLKIIFQLFTLRYLRLIPIYALIFWFHKSLFVYLGYGLPLWDHGLNRMTPTGACLAESWLSPFTFMASFRPLAHQCLGQCWSVANDVVFIVVLAPIILLLAKRPAIGIGLSVLLSMLSNAAMFWNLEVVDPGIRLDLGRIKPHAFTIMFNQYSSLYTVPQNRVFAVLVGALAGYALYHYNKGEKLPDWPNWMKGLATKLSIVTILISVSTLPMSPLIKEQVFSTSLFERFATTGRLVWSIANAVVILRMVTDWKDGYWMQGCANKFWKVISQLNLSVLLIHMEFLLFDFQTKLTIAPFTVYRFLSLFAHIYVCCLVTGLVVYIVFENPIDKLIKGYLMNTVNEKEKVENDTTSGVVRKLENHTKVD